MSVELLGECRKKLGTSLAKLDTVMEMFDSEQLERSLVESCKAEWVIRESKENLQKMRNDYKKSAAV